MTQVNLPLYSVDRLCVNHVALPHKLQAMKTMHCLENRNINYPITGGLSGLLYVCVREAYGDMRIGRPMRCKCDKTRPLISVIPSNDWKF